SYALMLTIAFLAGTILAVRRAKRYGIQPREVIKLVNIIIIASIVGSRILFVLENLKVYSENLLSILFIWQGGFSYNGALFLSLVCTFLWLRRKKISVGKMLDVLAPAIALGFFFVRIGCFLNGCCFGTPTEMSWGVIFPPSSPAGQVYENIKIHPTQLYSSFSGLISFFLLLRLEKKIQFAEVSGLLFLSFLTLSALWRFIIEFFRYQGHDSTKVGWFTEAQIYSMVIFIFSVIMITRICKKKIQR
ncbi:MAG: prolipoprotein diacylglyceryl transferase, partial [Planctomycetota bacterium]